MITSGKRTVIAVKRKEGEKCFGCKDWIRNIETPLERAISSRLGCTFLFIPAGQPGGIPLCERYFVSPSRSLPYRVHRCRRAISAGQPGGIDRCCTSLYFAIVRPQTSQAESLHRREYPLQYVCMIVTNHIPIVSPPPARSFPFHFPFLLHFLHTNTK